MFRIIELLALIILVLVVTYRFIIVPIYKYINRDKKEFDKKIKEIEQNEEEEQEPTYDYEDKI